MAVMPTLTRGMWIEAIAWLRSSALLFVAGSARRGPAVVLSFRSHALRARGGGGGGGVSRL